MVERDDVSVEGAPRDAPRELGVAKHVLSAMWAAEYAWYMTEAAKQLQQPAMDAEKSYSQALTSRQAPKLSSLAELEPEERRLALRARSMSHADVPPDLSST